MNLEIEVPVFITPLMKKWLLQYKFDKLKDITTLGLFSWKFMPNRRNPEKPRRIPRLGEACEIIESGFKRSIYFFEIDATTLHVFESSGFSLAGQSIAKEFILTDNQFEEKQILLKMIR
ncbi:MAG: hypothetical protein P8N74_05565 [Polaribacter sp.]|nr:hypothetical protein [Polaribacter sp.]